VKQSTPIPLDLAFTCGAGDVFAVFGPSGSGKTTLLRSIAGLYSPKTAEVTCGGETWLDTSARVNRPPHHRAVGVVFQDYALFPHMDALTNVMMALGHRPTAERRGRAEELLHRVHLSGRLDRRPSALSGGERQRVALARALAREPAVLLLDEPFAAVDGVVRRSLQDTLDEVRSTLDIPVVLVTHDFDDVVRLGTHLLVLQGGTSVVCGSLTDVMCRPDLDSLGVPTGFGSVFDGTVSRVDAANGLVDLSFEDGTLPASARGVNVGDRVRVWRR
jgi:molybdate transport system ATP-binding protein